MNKLSQKEVLIEFENFTKDKYSLILSSTNKELEAHTSYSPFVKHENHYYIAMSSSMPHYKNISSLKKAHAMIIEDEQNASHIFARKRLYFSCTCEELDKAKTYPLFKERFEDKLSFLENMDDFKIIKLSPNEQSLVLGFGAAYVIDKNGKLKQKNISHK